MPTGRVELTHFVTTGGRDGKFSSG